MAAAVSRVRLDLNSPEFQDVFFRLRADDLQQVVSALGRLRELDWLMKRRGVFEILALAVLLIPSPAAADVTFNKDVLPARVRELSVDDLASGDGPALDFPKIPCKD